MKEIHPNRSRKVTKKGTARSSSNRSNNQMEMKKI